MEPLLQLPHTFMSHFNRVYLQIRPERFGDYRTMMTTRNAAVGYLFLIELIERGNVSVDLTDNGEAPPSEFYIHEIPEGMEKAFAYFEGKRKYRDYYDLDDTLYLGKFISKLRSQTTDSEISLQRMKDALSGGVDEFTGLELLEDMFPDEGDFEEKPFSETIWGSLPAERGLMIDDMRLLISTEFE
jgi:hypothetical protein